MEKNHWRCLKVGPCENGYQLGFLIGKRFSHQIKIRVATDLILQQQLLPYSQTIQSQPLITSLCNTNQKRYTTKLQEGDSHNPFISKTQIEFNADTSEDDCSDILVENDSLAIAAHNEDANVALVGHKQAPNSDDLPIDSLASQKVFTFNTVPPTEDEIVAGSIGRNFISRDLHEATDIDDASSTRITKRAAELPKQSRTDFLQLLGDGKDPKYPIYMRGPTLRTLSTAMIDMDEQTLMIFQGNPKEELTSHVFQMSVGVNDTEMKGFCQLTSLCVDLASGTLLEARLGRVCNRRRPELEHH
ncbi:hypothetical protein RJ641_001348 [Dillenia turbinata]|uniref:Uncharacterized protein n=1 Tax=Dillenia turbinata TaxID=194707 RepID=A0AAN8WA48_9MAGN